MKLKWTVEAIADVEAQRAYIAPQNPKSADAVAPPFSLPQGAWSAIRTWAAQRQSQAFASCWKRTIVTS